jgi:hypothetical protein
VSDDALAAVVKDVRAGNAALAGDKALVSTAAELPKSRLMVFYVRRPGAPVDEPPMGIAISTEGNAVRTDMEIPGPMSGAMVQGIISLMQNFTGGGAAAPANNGQPNQPPPPIPGGGL